MGGVAFPFSSACFCFSAYLGGSVILLDLAGAFARGYLLPLAALQRARSRNNGRLARQSAANLPCLLPSSERTDGRTNLPQLGCCSSRRWLRNNSDNNNNKPPALLWLPQTPNGRPIFTCCNSWPLEQSARLARPKQAEPSARVAHCRPTSAQFDAPHLYLAN